jgi:aminoglycoside phosphotransferase (APT) family kinase protein
VYRLGGMGPGGAAVIAKRSRRAKALTERAIYVEVLPHVGVPAVPYYGFVDDDEDVDFAWLFVGDAGEERYSPALSEHRALGARWLGLLHTSATSHPAVARLPDRGPGFYREHLRSARTRLLRHLGNPALTRDDVPILEAVVGQCETLGSRWGRVEQLCQALPRTLVHGDFAPKNLRVRASSSAPVLLPFDWGSAGWGVPAADLTQTRAPSDAWNTWAGPDLDVYRATVRYAWPHVSLGDLEALAALGKAFRCLYSVDVEAEYLGEPWVEKAMRNMAFYQAAMADALLEVGWR